MDTETLYELINQSDLTLIGYTHKDERIKDALLSKINPIQVGRVKASFDIKQHLRDIKIDEVLSDKPFYGGKVLHIDLINVDTKYQEEDGSLYRAKVLRHFVNSLREQCVSLGYKAIMTSPLYQTVSNDTQVHNFMGGSSPMYSSDLVIKFESGDLKIIKNRYGKVFDISSDKLKKMLYI
jgi:hypothetical protein